MSSPVQSIRSRVHALIEEAWEQATVSGALPSVGADARPSFEIERPTNPDHGDLAANLALKLARPMRRSPLQIAEVLAEAMRTLPAAGALSEIDVAPPGFLNMRLSPTWLEGILAEAEAAGDDFGRVAQVAPRHYNVEFVSANPTGPLHVGNARGAFVGDLLCRVLEGAGHSVTREYYFNDAGLQIRNLGVSVTARKLGQDIPEDGYHGDYVDDLASELPDEVWAAANAEGADRESIVADWAQERVRSGIEQSLERLGVHFDVWKSESSLHTEGWVERSVEMLREAGHVYEEDGATWFRSTTFGDDKDRVIYRSGGQPTYFASDIGYVTEKFSRGFDKLIYIWGADHHGTVARVRNAAQGMGLPVDEVEMLLVAWVRFVRDGEEIPMSKRSGEFLALDELLEEVGVDAARWSFASRSASSPIDVDLELAKKQSAENPVYYVQYAHARISSILAKAEGAGISPATDFVGVLEGDDVAAGLARETLRLPEVVEDGARDEETHGITTYAMDVATAFHAFYRDRRVVDPDDPETSASRLALVGVTRAAIRNALALLGISAPESM